MQFEIDTRSKQKKLFLEKLMPSFINQLKLEKNRCSVIVTLQSDCDDDGLTSPLMGLNMYFIVLNSKQNIMNLAVSLGHEMVHVSQMAKGMLKTGSKGTTYWKGKRYSKNVPYLDRPWEIQAFSKQELLFRRAFLTLD